MGNWFRKMSVSNPNLKETRPKSREFESVKTFKFHEVFLDETNNGLYLSDVYLPEEVVGIILSHINPKDILKASLVCKKWCNIIKSESLWHAVYTRKFDKKAKKLPWYVYYCLFTRECFDTNLIKNGNGQDGYKHWKIVYNYGDEFRIEDAPYGADPLPPDIPEFNGKTSCFATSYYECNKLQEISFENDRLMQLIFNEFTPHIYVSEWVAGRFDCGCVYDLWCKLYGEKLPETHKQRDQQMYCSAYDNSSSEERCDEQEPLHIEAAGTSVEQWAGSTWSKIEMIVTDYPKGVNRIVFQHQGRDTQFWKGHYGSKMAGGVVKILFDTIESS